MLKLSDGAPAPKRLDLPGGAFLMVRPATALDYEICTAAAMEARAEIERGADIADLYRLPLDIAALADDRFGQLGLAETILMAELGARLIAEAGGIVMPDGTPFPTGDRRAASLLFMDAEIAGGFKRIALSGIHAVVAEGNGSGPSSTGATAGASNIAPAATPSEPPAPAAGAA